MLSRNQRKKQRKGRKIAAKELKNTMEKNRMDIISNLIQKPFLRKFNKENFQLFRCLITQKLPKSTFKMESCNQPTFIKYIERN